MVDRSLHPGLYSSSSDQRLRYLYEMRSSTITPSSSQSRQMSCDETTLPLHNLPHPSKCSANPGLIRHSSQQVTPVVKQGMYSPMTRQPLTSHSRDHTMRSHSPSKLLVTSYKVAGVASMKRGERTHTHVRTNA